MMLFKIKKTFATVQKFITSTSTYIRLNSLIADSFCFKCLGIFTDNKFAGFMIL